jgi:hypothetical protein
MSRSIRGTSIAILLTLMPATTARAQWLGYGYGHGAGMPIYGSFASPYGLGIPPGVFTNGFAYGAPYGGMGYGYGPGLGVNYYNSAYSVYAAPGATFFGGGPYGYPAAGLYGYPPVGLPGWGYGTGYAPVPVPGNYRYISTGPFMGLPRPNAGLNRVP